MKDFIKQNWLTIAVTLIGITSSFYFYRLSIASREPVFIADPVRARIIDSTQTAKANLSVISLSGELVKGDVSSIQFYFWNKGKASIKKTDILRPLKIYLSDTEGEILDVKILKSSRDVINVNFDHPAKSKHINLTFDILEYNDGLTAQVIYSGDKDAKLLVNGVIEGVRSFDPPRFILNSKLIILIILILFFIVLWGVPAAVYFGYTPPQYITKPFVKFAEFTNPKPGERSTRLFYMSTISVLILIGMIVYLYLRTSEFYLIDMVPKNIIPR
ncbi:MAG: hypothetical protein AB1499_10645 [Nitrospirota bacterium]